MELRILRCLAQTYKAVEAADAYDGLSRRFFHACCCVKRLGVVELPPFRR